jgi:hypothetical protein
LKNGKKKEEDVKTMVLVSYSITSTTFHGRKNKEAIKMTEERHNCVLVINKKNLFSGIAIVNLTTKRF